MKVAVFNSMSCVYGSRFEPTLCARTTLTFSQIEESSGDERGLPHEIFLAHPPLKKKKRKKRKKKKKGKKKRENR